MGTRAPSDARFSLYGKCDEAFIQRLHAWRQTEPNSHGFPGPEFDGSKWCGSTRVEYVHESFEEICTIAIIMTFHADLGILRPIIMASWHGALSRIK
jgi:hypothetical protein